MKKNYSKKFLIALVFCFFAFSKAFAQSLPVMNPIQGPSAVCSQPVNPQTFTTSASNSPTSYAWTVIGPYSSSVIIGNPSGAVTTISFPYPTQYATYTVYCTASNAGGTSTNASTFVVNVYETPTVTFSGANIFCQGSSTNLSASPTILSASSTLSYSWSPATGLSSTTGYSVHANPPSTTNYTVLLTLGNCTNTANFLLTVNPLPTISVVSSNTLICKGETATLTIHGNAASYSLNAVSSSTVSAISPTTTKTYTVMGMNSNGCSQVTTITQSVNACVGLRSESPPEMNKLFIYPNPNNGIFILKSGETDVTAVILNELGQTLRTINLTQGSEIKITGLSPGVYFLVAPNSRNKIIVTEN